MYSESVDGNEADVVVACGKMTLELQLFTFLP